MKNYLSLKALVFIFFADFVSAQTCNVPIFSRQSQVDSFRITNPNCEIVLSDLILIGPNINNTDSLYRFKEIKGNLIIQKTAITSLKGLDKIGDVKNITISSNDSLENISPFVELKTIRGDFLVENCPKLLSISVFPALEKINSFTITGNTSALKIIHGFEKLIKLSNFEISDNVGVREVSGFNNAFIDYINFKSNKSIQTIIGFNGKYDQCPSSTFGVNIGATLSFFNNDSLHTIIGFDSIKCVRAILVSQNPLLKEIKICNGAESGGDLIVIHNESLQKLIVLNEVKRTNVYRRFELFENPEINDLQIFKKIKNIEEVRISGLKIKSLNGSFGMLDSVYLNGTEGLVEISDNKYLTDISSLANLKYVHEISFGRNKNLGECSIESICRHLIAGRSAVFTIDNYPGCRSVNQVLSKCTLGPTDNSIYNTSITPNPSHDFVNLSPNTNNQKFSIEIYNINGLKLKSIIPELSMSNIDVSDLDSGVYIFFIADSWHNSKIIKFVKI